MAILAKGLTGFVGDAMPAIVVAIVSISAFTSIWFSTRRVATVASAGRIRQIFIVNRAWLFVRICGLLIVLMIFFKIGPEAVWSDSTGRVVLYELAIAIVSIFVFASFLMPLLTDYGLMDLV